MSKGATYIIAEMAYSHDGSPKLAKNICEKAARAGANAISVHFTHMPDYMVRHYRAGPGRVSAGKDVKPIYDYLVEISLSFEDWRDVVGYARSLGLDVVVMPNDPESLTFAGSLNPDAFVLSAACFEEQEFIRRVGEQKKPTYLRVGGATLGEIESVVSVLRSAGNSEITLLYGHQNYPTKISQTNLRYLPLLHSTFGLPVGLADHVDGDDEFSAVVPTMAVALGVSCVEKHMTHSRALRGEDHESALDEDEFKLMVERVRKAEVALGRGDLTYLLADSTNYRVNIRKRVVAARSIVQGEVITKDALVCKRSDEGAWPAQIELLVGQQATEDIAFDQGVTLDLVGKVA